MPRKSPSLATSRKIVTPAEWQSLRATENEMNRLIARNQTRNHPVEVPLLTRLWDEIPTENLRDLIRISRDL